MDSFEWTKIAGAVLAALLVIFGFKTFVEMRQEHATSDQPGYALGGGAAPAEPAKTAAKSKDGAAPAKEAAAEPAKNGAAPAAKEAAPKEAAAKDAAAPAAAGGTAGTVALFAKANAENGAAIFKKCAACHTNAKGKPKGVGPNLWGVVNRPKASFEGFEYSEGMKGKGGNWTFDDLATFIANPKGFVTGTKMVFNGLPNPDDAADVIAYLATLADTPVAMPK